MKYFNVVRYTLESILVLVVFVFIGNQFMIAHDNRVVDKTNMATLSRIISAIKTSGELVISYSDEGK